MAGTQGELVSQGYQLRYVNSVKEANDRSNDWPLLRYSQKDATPNKENSVFYKFGRLTAADYVSGDNYDTDKFGVIGGYNGDELLQSILVTPVPSRCPVWIGEDEFDKTQVNVNSPIINAQMDAMYKKGNVNMLAKLLAFVGGTYTRNDKDGTNAGVTLPAANAFGDGTVAFETTTNIKAFRKAAATLKSYSNGREYCWLMGIDAYADVMSSPKFTSKDWTSTTTSNGLDINRLLGGEVISMREFDGVFYPLGTETVGYIIGIAKNSIGFSARREKIKSIVKHIEEREAVFYNTKIPMAIEIIDEEDIIVFSYLK